MKKSVTIVILLLILFNSSLISQNATFELLISTPLDENFSDILEYSDGHIFFSSPQTIITRPYNKTSTITKLDANGNIVNKATLEFPDKSIVVNHILQNSGDDFIVVANIYDTLESRVNSGIVFYNMDNDLNLSNQTVYYFDPDYTLDYIFANIASNGNILAGIALRLPPGTARSYFYEFNNNFDSLRAKYYPNESRIISQIKDLPNGDHWLINLSLYSYEILDTALNITSEQKIPDWIRGNPTVSWDSDTSFYLVGKTSYPIPEDNIGFIRQIHPLDTTDHLYNHWRISDTVDYSAFWGGIDFKNKDSIFIGATRNMWASYYNQWPSWFIILQTDSLLNIRWERFYGGDAYYMMGKIIASNDGGCIVAGTRYDYLNTTEQETDIIILKLNSEGLITDSEELPKIKMCEAIVFPNPGSDVINVRIAVQYKKSVFELFDMNGKQIIKQNFTGTQNTVRTTFLEHGTYIYRITSNDGLFETGKWVKQ